MRAVVVVVGDTTREVVVVARGTAVVVGRAVVGMGTVWRGTVGGSVNVGTVNVGDGGNSVVVVDSTVVVGAVDGGTSGDFSPRSSGEAV